MFEIKTGLALKGHKTVIYGPEGIGKTTFASKFPRPVFIDTEGSTSFMDVPRFEPFPISSWSSITDIMQKCHDYPDEFKKRFNTLIIDTADWAEKLCIENVCSRAHKNGIEDFDYGKGYVYSGEDFGKLLNLLEEITFTGINVTITAHAKLHHYEEPDEMGSYDRWGMKLTKFIAPMLKEWADTLIFCNYKTYLVKDDKTKKMKGQGGRRMMYFTHTPAWDAKNRINLPEEAEMNDTTVRDLINMLTVGSRQISNDPETDLPSFDDVVEQPDETEPETSTTTADDLVSLGYPKPLVDLMRANDVTDLEIRTVVSQKGYYPIDTPVSKYDTGFVQGVLIGAWDQVFAMIKELRKPPFEE